MSRPETDPRQTASRSAEDSVGAQGHRLPGYRRSGGAATPGRDGGPAHSRRTLRGRMVAHLFPPRKTLPQVLGGAHAKVLEALRHAALPV